MFLEMIDEHRIRLIWKLGLIVCVTVMEPLTNSKTGTNKKTTSISKKIIIRKSIEKYW
jgi:hypothetical protein